MFYDTPGWGVWRIRIEILNIASLILTTMGITGIDLSGWLCLYSGFCLIRASQPIPSRDVAVDNARKKLAIPGYSLSVLGTLILGIGLFHRSIESPHKIDF